jgi:hypothetical protein
LPGRVLASMAGAGDTVTDPPKMAVELGQSVHIAAGPAHVVVLEIGPDGMEVEGRHSAPAEAGTGGIESVDWEIGVVQAVETRTEVAAGPVPTGLGSG